MQIITTIVPIFIVILIGWVIQRRNFIPPEFLGPANRLVYYVAIPAMIFKSVAASSFLDTFNPVIIGVVCLAAAAAYGIAYQLHPLLGVSGSRRGTFIQSAGHGNLGYIGLAVAFYYLGHDGFVQASVIAGFMMILQNILSVTTLLSFGPHLQRNRSLRDIAGKVMVNPIILSVVVGMVVSTFEIPLPVIIRRSLDMLSGLALPTALLIIGASLSFDTVRRFWRVAAAAGAIKLVGLPAVGMVLFKLLGVHGPDVPSALILMACPTATVTFVMSKEMYGDSHLATATISFTTLMSALTFSLWLKLSGFLL